MAFIARAHRILHAFEGGAGLPAEKEVKSNGRVSPRLTVNGVDGGNIGLDPESYEPISSSSSSSSSSLKNREEEAWGEVGGGAGAGAAAVDGGEISSQQPDTTANARKFAEAMATTHDTAVDHTPPVAATSPPTTQRVNPATVPVRTSSRSTTNGSSPEEQRRGPRKHRSMIAAVPEERRRTPEVDERRWLAQGKQHQHRHTMSSPPTRTTGSDGVNDSSNTPLPRAVGADLISGMAAGWSGEKEKILKGPFDYLESHPGKDIRTQLVTAFNAWLDVPASSLRIITDIIAMLHTASLLIDDVEDNSQLRRAVPVAHSIFGTAQTINSANYVYFCALQEVLKLNNPDAVRIYTEELLNLHRGQGMDLFWRDTLTCPSEDDYLEMVGNKTGGLFRLAIKLMCAESPTHNLPSTHHHADYIPLVNTIGLLFQILDDYRNLSNPTYTTNKGLCEDLTEGKFSFPIIHAIRADPSNLVLVNILKQKTRDDEVKKYAVSYMERCGSFAYTRRVLRGLTKKAVQLVEEVDGGRGRGELMREILEKLRVGGSSSG